MIACGILRSFPSAIVADTARASILIRVPAWRVWAARGFCERSLPVAVAWEVKSYRLRNYLTGFLFWLTARLRCRLIHLPSGPYLERYHVGTLFGCEILLHRFVRADAERHLHNHPSHGVAFVLTGRYREEVAIDTCPHAGAAGMLTTERNVRFLNIIPASGTHRIIDVKPGTWTLFIRGPRIKLPNGSLKGWGFYERVKEVPGRYGNAHVTRFRPVVAPPTVWGLEPLGRDAGREPLQ